VRTAALGGLPALGAVLVRGRRAAVGGRAARHCRQAGRLVALARAAQAPPPPPQQDERCERGERQQHRAADCAGDHPRDGRAPRRRLRDCRRPARARALRRGRSVSRVAVRGRLTDCSDDCCRTRRARLRARLPWGLQALSGGLMRVSAVSEPARGNGRRLPQQCRDCVFP